MDLSPCTSSNIIEPNYLFWCPKLLQEYLLRSTYPSLEIFKSKPNISTFLFFYKIVYTRKQKLPLLILKRFSYTNFYTSKILFTQLRTVSHCGKPFFYPNHILLNVQKVNEQQKHIQRPAKPLLKLKRSEQFSYRVGIRNSAVLGRSGLRSLGCHCWEEVSPHSCVWGSVWVWQPVQ